MWTTWGNPFNKNYSIRDRDFWNTYWDNCLYTEKQIYLALRNIQYACNNDLYGITLYEARYISPYPCQFLKGGMIERALYGEMVTWYEDDHPDWENPESKNYDENLRLLKD
jgi:hypothetical protein